MGIIFQWISQNVAESIAIVISVASLLVTIILSRREKPNIMPNGENVTGKNHLSLTFLNTSEFTIHNLTILVNGFGVDLKEINNISFSDKYLFSIGEKTQFHYGWILGDCAQNEFYFRVRFRGEYNSRFPIFSRRTFSQSIWYSAIPIDTVENGVVFKIVTTHNENIDKLEAKHSAALSNYEQNIDKKFDISCRKIFAKLK